MNPAEIVVHEVQRNIVLQILDLLAESIGQPSETPHAHSHAEILALRVARGNMCGVWITRHAHRSTAGAHWWTVVVFNASGTAIHFDQHGVVNLTAERICDGRKIRFVTIRGDLDSVYKSALEIVNELISRTRISRANVPASNKLSLRTNRRPRPDAPVSILVDLVFWQIGVLGIAETPNLIALNLGARQIPQVFILILRTRPARINEQFDHTIDCRVHHARCSADTVALDKAAEYLNPFFCVQFVHGCSMLARASIVNRKLI